jgi:hypothetical protein
VPYRFEIDERFSPRETTWVTGSRRGTAVPGELAPRLDAAVAPVTTTMDSRWPARMTVPRRPFARWTAATVVPYRFEIDERFSPRATTWVTGLRRGTAVPAEVAVRLDAAVAPVTTTMDSRWPALMTVPRRPFARWMAATVVPYRFEIDERFSPRWTTWVSASPVASVCG